MASPQNPNRVSIFAKTNFRGESRPIGIKALDRLRHMYIIGKSGVGKSTLIDNLVAQDIINGDGLALLDPHGSSAEKALKYIPENRIQDLVYFNPDDVNFPLAFNLIEDVHPDKRSKVANGLLSMLKKIWPDSFSARMEYLTMNMLLLLLENPGSTILAINRAFADKEYLKTLIANIKSPSLRSVWVDEILKYDEKFYREATAPIQNKVGQFISDPIIRNIVGQPKSSFDFSSIMNGQKIFIANLSKGKIDEQNARLLGGMLVTKIYLAAMGRADISEDEQAKLPPFYLYVDEFQNFASESYADILSEARKYKLGLTMAHQYVAQLPEPVRDAVFGNVGTMVAFLTGNLDAELFEKEFSPTFTKEDFTSLGFAQIYLKLLIDGIASAPFSGQTIAPWPLPERSYVQEAINSSRTLFGRDRQILENEIAEWFKAAPNKKDAEHERYILERRLEIEQKGGTWRDKESGQPVPKLSEEEIQAIEKRLTDIIGEPVAFARAKPVDAIPSTGHSITNITTTAMEVAPVQLSIPHHLIPKKKIVAQAPVIGQPIQKEKSVAKEKPQQILSQPRDNRPEPKMAPPVSKQPLLKREEARVQAPKIEHRNDLPAKKERVNVSSDLKNLLASISEDSEEDVVFSDIDTSFDVKRSFVKPKEQPRFEAPPKDAQKHKRLQDILHDDGDTENISLSDLLNKSIMHSSHVEKKHTREALVEDKESLSQTLARLGVQKKPAVATETTPIESAPEPKPKSVAPAVDRVPTQAASTAQVSSVSYQPTAHAVSEPTPPTPPRYIPDDILRSMLED